MPEFDGRRSVADVNPFYAEGGLEQAAQEARMRLAREVHDGVLQSLTAAAMRLEEVARLIETEPSVARARLREVQEMIRQEQRELRDWAERLKSEDAAMRDPGADLANALKTLQRRIAMQWRLRVDLVIDFRDKVPGVLGEEIYWIVQEALSNVGRHARAGLARVSIKHGRKPNPVFIAIADDGCGFPFRGRFDLAQLTARQLGPRSLQERVASLGGELVLTSDLSGSRLEITLPLERSSKSRVRRSAAI
jgi:signal transduction histidine kinase